MFLFFYFWPGAVEKARKQNEEKKKKKTTTTKKKEKHCKSHFQEFGNRPTSSEMNTQKKRKARIVSYGK